MPVVSVALPRPWWTLLSYESGAELTKGVRVRVPLGNSLEAKWIGLAFGPGEILENIEMKCIAEVVDETPPLPDEMMKSLEWFGHNWFLGTGMSMKTLLPSKFLQGETLAPLPLALNMEVPAAGVKYSFEPVDEKRLSGYVEMLEEDCSSNLVLFPEADSAKKFWERLPARLKEKGLLWSEKYPKRQWEQWQGVRLGEYSFVVGAQGASFLPMPQIRRIIVENEDSLAWCTQKHPIFHRRSLLAVRARNAGAELVLGGRIPSAKVALKLMDDPHAKEGIEKRVTYVDLHNVKGFETADIKDKLLISKPLERETQKVLEAGKFALWILDRKGYAGEIYCDDCGSAVYCGQCGQVMRWEEKKNRLYCAMCKKAIAVPESCPTCGSGFLAGKRPGIEAIAERAAILFRPRGEVLLSDEKTDFTGLREKYPGGALIVGTRKIIALADELDVALAGWIDADGEARSPEYDSRARAFGLIWESARRGIGPEARAVVIQSRRPDKNWQSDLKKGWGNFWERELRERKLLGLPPFLPMIKIEMPRGKGRELARKLEDADFNFWESEENSDELWVRTRHFEALRTILGDYYAISAKRTGIPAVTLYLN